MIFLASFLVLFLEVALIRWMPSYIRLLSFFSNFILLASFLGIGVGCLLASSRRRLFYLFPVLQLLVIGAVLAGRLEIAVPSSTSIYFSSGTDDTVRLVESTLLLPMLFIAVAALFVALAQRMAREMSLGAPLRAYTMNLAGSLAGVLAFGVCSWLQLPPTAWFGVAFLAAVPLLMRGAPGEMQPRAWLVAGSLACLALSFAIVLVMAKDTMWSPYYKVVMRTQGPDTVVEVNNIFHQSMAPLDQKEYFYQWPYMAFGDTFDEVLVLGAGSGTDVAAALRHGAKHVDAVEIDPAIIRLGRELHPDRPYSDRRVTVHNDDARHFLRSSTKKYDLVVFALIDSLTMQSSFAGVRLESYMFTVESFQAVREHLTDDGVLVIYNYFREPWLVDRLANTAATAFGQEPWVHVHEASAFLGVMMAGPRLATLTAPPQIPERVTAFGQSHAPSPARMHARDVTIEPATDDWPFLYLKYRHIPSHYLWAIAMILGISVGAVLLLTRGQAGAWSWQFFLLGAGFMMLETKSIIQLALLWGSTWVVASLAIASVLTMALIANFIVSRIEVRRAWLVGGVLLGLLGLNYVIPVGAISFGSLWLESAFYVALIFSPIVCAGLLFGSAIKHSRSVARDYGTNLLGAMAGGVGEYLSLVTGFNLLLVVIAVAYVGAVLARRSSAAPQLAPAGPGTA
ncbi:MAG: methyltransferase domain-containing protein [Acidobacteriota bacterium]|nr:methyltransferase domain-containing protein [Acidobacteriota bacterium]